MLDVREPRRSGALCSLAFRLDGFFLGGCDCGVVGVHDGEAVFAKPFCVSDENLSSVCAVGGGVCFHVLSIGQNLRKVKGLFTNNLVKGSFTCVDG